MRKSFKQTVRHLSLEAGFEWASDIWVGPVVLIALAGTLGIPVWIVSLISAIPWLGCLGQLLTLKWYVRETSLRAGTLAWVKIGRGIWILPLVSGIGLWLVSRTLGRSFPVQGWFLGVVIVGVVSSVSMNSGTQLWLAWVRGVLPKRIRGRVLGVRQRFVFTAVILAHLVSSAIIGWQVEGLYVGVALICVLSLTAGALAYHELGQVPDVSFNGPKLRAALDQGALKVLLEPWQSGAFRAVLLSGGSFNFALQFGGPYFIYYFTHQLKISMGTVAAWAAAASLGSLIASPFWGTWTDRTERLDRLYTVAGSFFVVSPLVYLLPAQVIPLIAPWEYLVNGFGWAGYTLILTSQLLIRCRDAQPGWEPVYFSVFSAFNGLCGASGALLGGKVLDALVGTERLGLDGYGQHWVLTSALRVIAVFGVFRLLRPLPTGAKQAMPQPS